MGDLKRNEHWKVYFIFRCPKRGGHLRRAFDGGSDDGAGQDVNSEARRNQDFGLQ